jgi:hypothetical protein
MTPRNNLGLQTAAIGGARAFVGTYGGLSYLPPFLGVPTIAFYSHPAAFRQHHLEMAQRIFRNPSMGPYSALHTSQISVLHLLAPAVDGARVRTPVGAER